MQIANSLDKETIKKILRSVFYCFTSGLGAGFVAYSQTQSIETAILTGLGAFGTMVITFTKEYVAGEK